MAYKNTEGNSSIANQMGTWRYFNSSLQKLGTYKPAPVSINPKGVTTSKEQVDWADAAWKAANGALGLFEVRKQASYAKADKYLRDHSIEQYRKAMAQGSIPFQDDPLAMQRLKYNHGKIVFQLAQQDFLSKVQRGDYINLEPQEVDAKHYQYIRSSMQEVKDSFPMFNPEDDYWFNQGFYSQSPKTRLSAVLKNTQVTNDALVKESIIQTKARIKGLVNSGATPDQVLGAIDQAKVQLGNRMSIEQTSDFVKDILNTAGQSQNGVQVLNALRNYKIPGADVTFEDYIGKDSYDAAIIKANSFKLRSNAAQTYLTQDKVESLVSNGDQVSIKALRDAAVVKSGNRITPQVQYLNQAYLRARRINQTKNGQALKDQAIAYQSTSYAGWLNSFIQGHPNTPTEEWIRQNACPNLTANQRKLIQQQVVQKILMSGNKDDINKLLNAMSSVGAPYEARDTLANVLKNQYQDIQSQIFNAVKTGKIPVAVDQNGQPLPDYQYKIPGQNVTSSVKFMPKSFRTLMDLYSLNPSAVTQLLGSSNQNMWQLAQQADLAIRLGQNPMMFIVKAREFDQKAREQSQAKGTPYRKPTFNHNRYQIQGLQNFELVNPSTNDALAAVAKNRAIAFKLKNPSASLSQAYKEAQDQVSNQFIGVQNVILPISSLSVYMPKGAKVQTEDLADVSNKVFQQFMKKNGLTKKNDYLLSYYDVHSNSIRILNDVGYQKGSIPIAQFGKALGQYVQNDRKSFLGLFSK